MKCLIEARHIYFYFAKLALYRLLSHLSLNLWGSRHT